MLGYAGAALTAYSRVESEWHFGDDVLAGASNAILWTQVFVTPHPSRDRKPGRIERGLPPRWRYNFYFGSGWVQGNEVRAPSDGGTGFDLASFEKLDDPTTTAVGELFYDLQPRHRLMFSLRPFESRDVGQFSEETQFGGVLFPDSTDLRSAWRQYDLRAQWRYGLVVNRHWDIRIGAGLLLQDTYVSLANEDQTIQSTVEDVAFLPYATGAIGLNLGERWQIGVQAEGTHLGSTDWFFNPGAQLQVRLNPHWAFQVGYVSYSREISTDELFNRTDYEAPFGGVSYAW